MKFVVNMNLSPSWIQFLASKKIEAVHWSDVGAPTAPDSEIMAFARDGDYVVLTHDLDFSAILAATQGLKPSVMQIRSNNLKSDNIGSQVVGAMLETSEALEKGALVTVEPGRTRARLLPL